jgi:SAM-dependent methyltransferase
MSALIKIITQSFGECAVTQERANWVPANVDVTKPSAARAYDAYLGGSHNFAVDRQFAKDAEKVFPGVALACRANRAFLRRAVLFGLRAGIRQFLDIGSGIPTVGNVHEVVQEVEPSCPVVYVDNEPVAVAHSELLLQDNDRTGIVAADLRSPESILDHPTTRELLDFDQPIMLLMLALLHFVPDDDEPAELVRHYRDALSPGSHLVITHATGAARPDEMRALEALYATSSNPAVARSPEWITSLFGEFKLVEPGAVFVPEWHADSDTPDNPQDYIFFGGVGAKP